MDAARRLAGKAELDVPVTLDDWYNVLKAFKEQDPNGNGEADEIPYTTRNTQAGVLAFMEAFGISGFEANEQFLLRMVRLNMPIRIPDVRKPWNSSINCITKV